MRNLFMRAMKTPIRLRECAGLFESSLGANVRRYVFSYCAALYAQNVDVAYQCRSDVATFVLTTSLFFVQTCCDVLISTWWRAYISIKMT